MATATSTGSEQRRDRSVAIARVFAAAIATALAVDAYVHFHDAHIYDAIVDSGLSQGTLFRIEGGVAVAVALALVIWPRHATFATAFLVLASAFGAVMLYRYVNVGPIGPLPNMYEPTWVAPGKLTSVWVEGLGALGCLAAVATLAWARRRTRATGTLAERTESVRSS